MIVPTGNTTTNSQHYTALHTYYYYTLLTTTLPITTHWQQGWIRRLHWQGIEKSCWNTKKWTPKSEQVTHSLYSLQVLKREFVVRESLKQLKKDYEKSEDDLKALQSVGQIIGEVLKQLDDDRCKWTQFSPVLRHFSLYSYREGFEWTSLRGGVQDSCW